MISENRFRQSGAFLPVAATVIGLLVGISLVGHGADNAVASPAELDSDLQSDLPVAVSPVFVDIKSTCLQRQGISGGNLFPRSARVARWIRKPGSGEESHTPGGAVVGPAFMLRDFPGSAGNEAGGLGTTVFQQLDISPQVDESTIYFVSKTGNNRDGRSWATAWNELDQIKWDVVQPGDTIFLDGGQSGMIYTSPLTIGKSGTSEDKITIILADEPGRDGQVVIFGGRTTPLPFCGQTDYVFQTDGVGDVGIQIEDYSWLVIDGRKWSGITIFGHNRNGIRFYGGSEHVVIRNVEIYDNGRAFWRDGGWYSDGPGVDLKGTKISFERVIIHDNGQDSFQSGGEISGFTLRHSWLHNSRKSPTGDEAFNYCMHPDGIQIYSGGILSGFLIEETIIGPGFMQGVILGDTGPVPGGEAIVNDVTFRNALFTKAGGNSIMGYPNIKSERWLLDRVTVHSPMTTGQSFFVEGSGHVVKDSIFHSGNIYVPDGLQYVGGNCQWRTTGFELGQIVDPQFVGVNGDDPFSLDDYSLASGSPCLGKGSRLTSVAELLSQTDQRLIFLPRLFQSGSAGGTCDQPEESRMRANCH